MHGTVCSSPSNPCGVVMADTIVFVVEWGVIETILGGDGKVMSPLSCCNSDGEFTPAGSSAPTPPLESLSSTFPIVSMARR